MDLTKGCDQKKMILYAIHYRFLLDSFNQIQFLISTNILYTTCVQVRLQLEALLAEKSRLANENANLSRENRSLHQLVEYHQATSQDLSASYDNLIRGMCLDFSSPKTPSLLEEEEEEDQSNRNGGETEPLSPKSLDKCFKEQ